MRFDSLREITSATMMERRKLAHLRINDLPRRSTLSDANARRPHEIFGKISSALPDVQGQTFIGQPLGQGSEMDEEAADNRFHDHQPLLQPCVQGRWTQSQDGKEERRHKGTHVHPRQ